MNYKIISLKDCPELKKEMAEWFSEIWGLLKSAYLESMEEGLEGNKPYPCWYAAFEGSPLWAVWELLKMTFTTERIFFLTSALFIPRKTNEVRA